jgi:hypothetical protein
MRVAMFGASFLSLGVTMVQCASHRWLVLGRRFFVGEYRSPSFDRVFLATFMLLAVPAAISPFLFAYAVARF